MAALSRALVLAWAVSAPFSGPATDLQPGVYALLTQEFKFSPEDIADLERGKVIKRGLDASSPGEVAAVGAVRVRASRELLLERYRDIAQFKRGPNVPEVGRFSHIPTLDDLAGLTIGPQDVDVRTCRVGRCDIRLSAEAIGRFQREIDWKAKDADQRAAALFKQLLFEHVRAYVSGGVGRITQYDDERRAVHPLEEFAGLLKNAPYLRVVAPGLPEHLREFPASPLPGAEDFLYWSKEKFGLAPFISVTHVTLVPGTPGNTIIASRDVYSSRYFDASLTLTVASDSVSDTGAFYLVYSNRSRADGLKGALGSLRRTIAERRAKGSLDENLRNVKNRLESTLPVK